MQSILRSAHRLGRRPGVFPVARGAPRRFPSGLARPDLPFKPVAPVVADKLLDKLPGFAYEPWLIQHGIGVRSEKEQVKMKDMDCNNLMVADCIGHSLILDSSSHRDGAIYKRDWEELYDMDMSDRNETVSELKMLSTAYPCDPDQENCIRHVPFQMVHVFSLSLAKTPVSSTSVQLYGYMAARDDMDGRLNYVFKRSRDDPLIVQQGSLIEMTGPKRGIVMISNVLFEFDMRIKTGEKEEDDIQLIDGVTFSDVCMLTCPVSYRISGSCGGAVDMTLAFVELGVEAVIEVIISEVQSAFDLSISSFLSKWELEEFQLFHGTVGEVGMKRFVVAVPWRSTMYLKFKVGQKGSDSDAVHDCPFNAKVHGCTSQQIKLEEACISVKVNWSPPFF
ncbi:hypothetical protein EJB05_16212 [Eragrostis curvula]|uniref:DUF6598 domain-containing protein n=1 Tax=Eragrostis curvula TaxID=38414 RepID=A0A5J9VHD7_9POAL|nr:hypothetical protein EJB05_16212 [Eragrostis curvula]